MAPWSMAILAGLREDGGIDVETMWTDDGIVVRFPDTDEPPDPQLLLPDPDEVEALVLRQLGATSLFAARFREAAARALLLPRRRIGGRTPLWQQRKRAADLLAVASRFGSFPMLLETYRECLRDVFDLPALVDMLRAIRERAHPRRHRRLDDALAVRGVAAVRLRRATTSTTATRRWPSAGRRRCRSITRSSARCSATPSCANVLDRDAIDDVERELQHLDARPPRAHRRRHARSAAAHRRSHRRGDRDASGDPRRRRRGASRRWCGRGAPLRLPIAGEPRLVAVEDASRYRDALGTPLPPGLPASLLEPVRDPLLDLVMRHARTHGPFTTGEVARRFALGDAVVEKALRRAVGAGRLHEGDFRPGGTHREWCEPGVLGQIRRRSLAKVRHRSSRSNRPRSAGW